MSPRLPSSGARPFGLFNHIGLRARITITFTLGAAIVAGLVSLGSLTISQQSLLSQRESVVSSRAQLNAVIVSEQLGVIGADAQEIFASLATAGSPSVLIPDAESPDGTLVPISFDTRYGAATVPEVLIEEADRTQSAQLMRYQTDGEPVLAVATPLADGGFYIEVNQLEDIANNINDLAITVLALTLAAMALAAFFGYRATKRMLRPLRKVNRVAEQVATGDLEARLGANAWDNDPDLAPLVKSFNEMVATLERRVERDARFASDVSHELRSPLTTFNASIEVMQNEREHMPPNAQSALDLLTSDMERFTQLVEDLLEISRFDAGAVRLDTDEVAIAEAVRSAVRTLTSADLPVEVDPRLEDAIVELDKRRLVRVLANYIDNARKYGDGATAVSLEYQGPDEPNHEGDESSPSDFGYVLIAVEDEGPGVNEATRDKIFDRFHRGDQSGSRGGSVGVGLGLALAAEHARLHGGATWAEDRPGAQSGARFVLKLPLTEPLGALSAAIDTEPTPAAPLARPPAT